MAGMTPTGPNPLARGKRRGRAALGPSTNGDCALKAARSQTFEDQVTP
ncbi:MAG: hypothetical protein PWP23_1672 [Candidatus Sumerlaeota bacterium]|nr:hypothetical protein [Candidatus Sumerlaeota bacterium]